MSQSLGEALPEAIAKVSELLGAMEAQAKELNASSVLHICDLQRDHNRIAAD